MLYEVITDSARVDLEQKNQEMLSEIEQVKEETAQMNAVIVTTKDQLNQQKVHKQTIAEKLSALNQEMESNKARLMDLVTQEAQYKNIYQTTINNKESLQRRLTKVDDRITSYNVCYTKLLRLRKRKITVAVPFH